MLNSIGDAVVCTDIAGNITFLNLVAEQMTGWSRQEAVDRPMAEVCRILDATTRKITPKPMGKAIVLTESKHLEEIASRRRGKLSVCSLAALPTTSTIY
jgi:PAS domain S-box-containing protein